MIIDKSHSKKDIVNLFSKLGVNIDDELTKGKIVSDIEKYFEDVIYNDKIKNCTELKDYLKRFLFQNMKQLDLRVWIWLPTTIKILISNPVKL